MHRQSDQLKEMFVLLSDPLLCCIQYRLVRNAREGIIIMLGLNFETK